MTEKKMRKWLKTFVMLLPVVMIVLFGVHLHRHDLEPVEMESDYYQWIPFEIGDTFEIGETITTENVSNLQNVSLSYDIETIPNPIDGTMPYNRLTYTVIWYAPSDVFSVSLNIDGVYIDDIRTSQFVFADPTTNGFEDVSYIVNSTFRLHNIRINDLSEDPSTLGSFGQLIDTFTLNRPLEIIGYEFNNYVDRFFNFKIFNIDEFYDWTVITWFEGSAPLYYKPVFALLVYEFIVELLFLMFSFITFIIRFAQKWIDGLYERRN